MAEEWPRSARQWAQPKRDLSLSGQEDSRGLWRGGREAGAGAPAVDATVASRPQASRKTQPKRDLSLSSQEDSRGLGGAGARAQEFTQWGCNRCGVARRRARELSREERLELVEPRGFTRAVARPGASRAQGAHAVDATVASRPPGEPETQPKRDLSLSSQEDSRGLLASPTPLLSPGGRTLPASSFWRNVRFTRRLDLLTWQ